MTTRTDRKLAARRTIKRLIDVVVCIIAIPLMLPIMVVIALSVRTDTPGPVLYRARRIGRDMKPFDVLKFRTMSCGTAGPGITRSGDARITRTGRWLRASKLDELPQVFNVLRGEMSLVGPRPEDPRYVEAYTTEQREVLGVRPGMTCSAYLEFGDEQAYIERARPADVEQFYLTELLPEKLAIELRYVRGWSVMGDIAILARTMIGIVSRGA